MLNDELLELVLVTWKSRCNAAVEFPIAIFQTNKNGCKLITNGPLTQLWSVAKSSTALEFIEQLIHFGDFTLQAAQLWVIGVALLEQLLSVLIERLTNGIALILTHGHKLIEIPALDHFDRSEDHVLAHPHLLLKPKALTAVILPFESVGRFRCFRIALPELG